MDDFDVEEGWGDEQHAPQTTAEWLRVAPGQTRELVILSNQPARYDGHWHQPSRRFRKCTPPRCSLCAQAVASQRRFVVAVLDPAGTQWLWEFGLIQAGQVRALMASMAPDGADPQLRGLSVVLVRPPGRAGNLPLSINAGEPVGAGFEDAAGAGLFSLAALPEPVDVSALLWGVWSRQALKSGSSQARLPMNLPPSARPSSSGLTGSPVNSPEAVEAAQKWRDLAEKTLRKPPSA